MIIVGILLLLITVGLIVIRSINNDAREFNASLSAEKQHKRKQIIDIPGFLRPSITGIFGLILLFGGMFNPFSVNDAGNRQVVQTVDGKLWVKFDPGFYFSGFWSKVTTYPNNVTVQVGPEEKKSEKADYWEVSHTATFSEGDQATVGHTVKWDLPNGDAEMIELHTTYSNIDNLMTTTLLQYQKETMNYSTQRLSSEGHYSGGQSQLKEYFQDQLRNGQVLLVTETKTRKLQDSTTKTYIEVRAKTTPDGRPLRTESDIQKYKLLASFSSVDYVKYDDRIYQKLKAKIDAASDEATAKQQLITAQQEALTVKAKGEKLIAETNAREEAARLEAVIRSQKEADVAEQNLKRDKLKAQSDLAIKRANAEGDRLKVAAGLTPLEKANIEKETAIGVAKALAGPQGIKFPEIVAGGGTNGGGALQTLELKMLHDLSKEMSK